MPEENLYKVLKTFTKKERAVLAYMLKQTPGFDYVHAGMLPFLPRRKVLKTLLQFWAGTLESASTKRLHSRIILKLAKPADSGDILNLNSGKVYRRFGPHPERGVTIPGLPTKYVTRKRRPFERRERGLHWDGKAWVQTGPEAENAVDIVHRIVALRCIGPNRWMVDADVEIRAQVARWLNENVGG